MPIMSANEENDARGTARLLALVARDCIGDPGVAAAHEVALNNVFRLLEAYRANPFFGLEPRVKPFPPRGAAAISLLPRAERRVKDVRVALERAVTAVFPGQSKEDAIRALENVLRGITYPEQAGQPSANDRAKAGSFFDRLVAELNVG